MIFHVVAVGRLRNADLRSACDDYEKRIRRYAKLQIHEVTDVSGTTRNRRLTLDGERDKLVSVLKPKPVRVLLTRTGRSISSKEFSGLVSAWQENARDTAFVIGGAYGVHSAVSEMCTDLIRLSHMTLPHEMARLLLLEQIYRGFTILKGEPYHKGD